MAIVYGVNRTKILDPKGNNILDPGLVSGRVRCITDSYVAAALTRGYIYIGPTLPVGAIITEITMTDAVTSSNHLTVGTSQNPALFIAIYNTSRNAASVGPQTAAGANYVVTGSSDNCIVIENSGNVLMTGTIKATIKYIVD